MFFIGYDIGSSSIKASLLDGTTNKAIMLASSPENSEMEMSAPKPGWAEQDPETWWHHVCLATNQLLAQTKVDVDEIKGIGIAYQMHGLVMVDKHSHSIRPSIIWCDSRAVDIGDRAFAELGSEFCLGHLLNSPGNFTASKLKWIQTHEPETLEKTAHFMLPGDFVAMKMTDKVHTTISGLSEGILWDFKENAPSDKLLTHLGIPAKLVPEQTPSFGAQGKLTVEAAQALGLRPGTPVTYRAGDQPNNAMSLGVLAPGEVAATGGTSGVVYGVNELPIADKQGRINSFAHVNFKSGTPRTGTLLCINGAGILHRWMKQLIGNDNLTYPQMEALAEEAAIGSDGVVVLPFGNGAERMLGNRNLGASITNLELNRHSKSHIARAGLEGIAFAFVYGMKILNELGVGTHKLRVGNDNLFQSSIFSHTIASLIDAEIEVIENTGATGAARGAAFGAGYFDTLEKALAGDAVIKRYRPNRSEEYHTAYGRWLKELNQKIKAHDESK